MTKLLSELEMKSLLKKEIESMEPEMRRHANSILIPLKERTLVWEYEDGKEHQAWEIAIFKEDNSASFCLGGHGKNGYPWGLTLTTDNHFGMANLWFDSFESMLAGGRANGVF